MSKLTTFSSKCLLVFTLVAASIVVSGNPGYEWKLGAPAGTGCFAPKCEPGQFPMATYAVEGFGGKLYLIGDNAVWTSDDGIKWNAPVAKTDWGPRYGLRFASFKGRLWMLGGMRSWDDFRNDVWLSTDGTAWKQVVINAPWHSRRGHGTVVFKNKIWVIGGTKSSGRPDQTPTSGFNDVWSSEDGIEWKLVNGNAPFEAGESANTVVLNDRIWVIGRGSVPEVWSTADGRDWVRNTSAAEWGTRAGYAVAALDGRLWVYGGIGKNDVWSSVDGVNWTRVFQASPWSTRSTTFSTVYKDRLLLFSGKTGRADTQQGEIWAMSRRKG